VHRFASENKAKLVDFGISDLFLANFELLADDYSAKVDEFEKSKTNRTEETKIRREVANRVWAAMVQICTVGRMVWMMEDNGTMYKEYVLL